jgi:hypothetical protein
MKPKQIDLFQNAGIAPAFSFVVSDADGTPVDWDAIKAAGKPDPNQTNIFNQESEK